MLMIRRLASQIIRSERPVFAMMQSVGVQIALVCLNFSTGVLTARFLGPEGRGIFAAVTAWPQFLALLALAGMGKAIIFRLRAAGNKSRVVGAGVIILAITATLFIVIGIFTIPLVLNQYPLYVVFVAQVCLVGVYVNAAHMYFRSVSAAVGKYHLFNISSLLPQACYLLALVIAIVTARLTPTIAAGCLVSGGLAGLLATLPAVLRAVPPSLKDFRNQTASLVHYASRAAASDFVGAAAGSADRLILIPLVPPAELGLYAVAFSFSRVILIVQPAIATVFFSSMSGRPSDEIKKLHDQALRITLPTLVLGCGMLVLLGHWLLRTVYGAEFAAAEGVFIILACEAVLSCLCQLTSLLYLSLNRPGLNSSIQVTSFVVSVTCALVLVPQFGSFGAGAALLAGSALRWILLIVAIKVKLGLSPPSFILTKADIQFLRGKLGI